MGERVGETGSQRKAMSFHLGMPPTPAPQLLMQTLLIDLHGTVFVFCLWICGFLSKFDPVCLVPFFLEMLSLKEVVFKS